MNKSITKNFIFNLIKTLSGIIFPVITFTYASRTIGVSGIGKFNFTHSIIVYFTMLATLGMTHYGTREAAKIRDDRRKLSLFAQEMLTINLISTSAAYILFLISLAVVSRFQDYTALLLVNSISIVLSGMGIEWLYSAMEEYRYISLRAIAFQIISFLLLVVFVKSPEDIVVYAAINMLASTGPNVVNLIYSHRFITLKRQGCLALRRHIKPILILFCMTLSVNLYTALDSTMLGFLQGDEAVGLYSAGIKINKICITIITSLGTVLIPRLSYYIELGRKQAFQDLVDKAYHFVFILSVPICIGLNVLSDEIINLFSGEEFAQAAVTMRILTLIVLVIPFSVLTNNQIFVPMKQEKKILISTCLGAITNFCANMVLIPRYAENGAAIGTVIAETMVMLVCFYYANKYLKVRSMLQGYWKYWIASAPIIIIGYIVKSLGLHQIVTVGLIISLSCISYFFILVGLKDKYVLYTVAEIEKRWSKRKSKDAIT